MANLRDIKNRIASVKNTKQITNAMKMVAAAKLRRAQERIINARPYADHIDRMLRILKHKNRISQHPLISGDIESDKDLLVILTADRGLCGSFNSNVIKRAKKYLDKNPNTDFICVGKKGFEQIGKKYKGMLKKYIDVFNEMDFSVSSEIGLFLLNEFLAGKYKKIKVLYNEFKSAIQQDIKVKQLFPIIPIEKEETTQIDFLYEPDANTIIEELGRKYVDVEIWKMMLESSAAEQGARMTAMDSATDNAEELIDQLTLDFNRKRQESITTEIIEIASGAEAIQ